MEESERGRRGAWTVASPLLTPALMVYYLCCWPGDAKSETSSGSNSRSKPAPRPRHESVTRRASDLFHRKIATSVVSLHLPSTSGHKKDHLSAHRSHEEIRRHGRGVGGGVAGGEGHEGGTPTSRYHSAPSVIDEVLHRRDWERSTRDLHIPLRSPGGSAHTSEHSEHSEQSPPAAARTARDPECSSIEEQHADRDEQLGRVCKKHYTNIKSSKRKEKEIEDKDCDATEVLEPSTFYIGDNDRNVNNSPLNNKLFNSQVFKAKEAKQSFNESIRKSDRPRQTLVPLEENLPRTFGFSLDDVIDRLDRSGATHHTIESRISLSKPPHPPPSVDAVGYDGGACYLSTCVTSHADVTLAPVTSHADVTLAPVTSRARHASDGDILAPAHACRPESGAFSESDLDLEVEVVGPASEELPPPYEELQYFTSPKKKETAI